jgi:pimeloyl-ACP methyl ester carboxylesterase
VLTFDLPGFGRSGQRNDVYSPERYVKFVRAMMARHFDEPAFVLGHSLGGGLAILLASRYPDAIAAPERPGGFMQS